jgi:hypothetical protein
VNTDGQKLGDAELLLARLNCTIQLSALKGFQCNPILRELGEAIRNELRGIGVELGDLKMTLAPEVDVDGVATADFGRNQQQLQLGPELDEPVERGRLNLNVRAQAKADHLHAAVTRAMNHTWGIFPQIFVRLAQMEHFGPTQPAAIEGIAN